MIDVARTVSRWAEVKQLQRRFVFVNCESFGGRCCRMLAARCQQPLKRGPRLILLFSS